MPPFHIGALWPARRHCRRLDMDPHALGPWGWGDWCGGHGVGGSETPSQKKRLWGQEGPCHFLFILGAFEQDPLGV